MKYIILRQFLGPVNCADILDSYNQIKNPVEINLVDDPDLGNVEYQSNRSPNVSYKYMCGYDDSHIIAGLKDATGLNFKDSINEFCLPVFKYGLGGQLLAHRDTCKESDIETPQEYIAVLMLSKRGRDFTGGRLYINPKATVSPDGKTVTNDFPEDRFYPELDMGDLFIFHNPSFVHGVEEVKQGTSPVTKRITCGWRTNECH